MYYLNNDLVDVLSSNYNYKICFIIVKNISVSYLHLKVWLNLRYFQLLHQYLGPLTVLQAIKSKVINIHDSYTHGHGLES